MMKQLSPRVILWMGRRHAALMQILVAAGLMMGATASFAALLDGIGFQ